MAAQKTASKNTATNAQATQPTAAMRMAALFDKGKDKFVADVRKPVEDSATKKTLAVAAVGGLAIGLWELAGM
jgi:hypothetical protein